MAIVFLGYDGGGSKCAFLLVDENLNVLAEKELRIVDYPEESNLFAAMIRDGILAVAEDLKNTRSKYFQYILENL